jgi:hypothetical protein
MTMKKFPLALLSLFLILASCERNNTEYFSEPVVVIDQNLKYSFNDFELYDSSAHILYFKESHPELINNDLSGFDVYADNVKIYHGIYQPGYSSSMPTEPFIWEHPIFYPDYVLRFEFMGHGVDPRNDDRLMSAFKNKHLLHSGLFGEIKDVVINGPLLRFTFKITNKDESNILILDPEKMGQRLFQYYANPPVFYNVAEQAIFQISFDSDSPLSMDTWSLDWMTELEPGDSKEFTLSYTLSSQISPGDYKITFRFPGLSRQITRDQLYQDDRRIWLGDITLMRYLRL